MDIHACFGAGSFYDAERAFRKVDGVQITEVGYMGGVSENPTYEDVCGGKTGHIEVVRVTYDPRVITYKQLLDVFWGCHNPTHLNHQAQHQGHHYRSTIFYYDEEQRQIALSSREALANSGDYEETIVTEILPASTFWRAEEEHQNYHEKHHFGNDGPAFTEETEFNFGGE